MGQAASWMENAIRPGPPGPHAGVRLGGLEALPGFCVRAGGLPRADHPVSLGTTVCGWNPGPCEGETPWRAGEPSRGRPEVVSELAEPPTGLFCRQSSGPLGAPRSPLSTQVSHSPAHSAPPSLLATTLPGCLAWCCRAPPPGPGPQTPSGGAAAHWGPSWSVEAAVSENSPPPARAQPVCWCAAAPTPASALGSGFRPPGGELPTCSWGSQWWEGPWPRGGPTTGEDAVRATGTGWEGPWALCRPTWLA